MNHQTGETFDETYDKLILSPGASANTLGFTNDFTFTLRNAEDMDQIDQYITRHKAKRALVVGAGYISLEVLENLYQRGLDVTWIHRSDKVNKLMDQDMNAAIFSEIDQRNISYRLNEEIESIQAHTVYFKSGIREDFDIIIEGIGTHPNSSFYVHQIFI